ncbi:universal stress protein [Usitatibacter palustris]|uniref:TRAP-T-associated universal stress protein TeaD n=1 Tax=Usitatibacter palustris TaxID=2732487 RepID=A0A6M4H3Y7_9PROT|nr:universal stress protein [Usitatibacter palustris]QJR14236.1 TRAP-T-associated universal stress protein TeaD [Usitatibacter palustris]
MYKHILVPTDGSPLSLKAAKEAAALGKALKAKITAVYVSVPWMPPMHEDAYINGMSKVRAAYDKNAKANAAKALGKVKTIAKAASIACEELHVQGDQPWKSILAAVKARKCDVIVMASHGRGGVASLLLGSETHKILAHSKTPVVVCR